MSSNHNPRRLARKFQADKPPASVPRILSDKQLGDILAAAEDDPKMRDLHAVVTVVTTTGIRSRELRELRWANVDLQNHQLVVQAGHSFPRHIPLGPKALQILKERRDRQPDTEFVLGNAPASTLLRVMRQLRILKERLGFEHLGYHTLRQTFFIHWIISEGSLCSLAAIAGWKSYGCHVVSLLRSAQQWQLAVKEQARLEEKE